MAAAWGITRKSQNIEFTYKWAIENFDFAMVVGEGELESPSFCIPAVPGEFHVVVRKECTGIMMKLGDQEASSKFHFSVELKSTVTDTKASGMLEVSKEGAGTLTGQLGDAASHYFPLLNGFENYFLNSGRTYLMFPDQDFQCQSWFFTTGSTCLLNLVATITIPGKLSSIGGTAAEEEMKKNMLMDFQPLLSDPKHSDIVIKCGDTRFPCHKVILAARFVRISL